LLPYGVFSRHDMAHADETFPSINVEKTVDYVKNDLTKDATKDTTKDASKTRLRLFAQHSFESCRASET
jgi:hypothetical protein